MYTIIRDVADEIELNRSNIRVFLNNAFTAIAQEYNLCEDFQRRAKFYGDTFEICFQVIMERFFPEIPLTPGFAVPEACLVDGGDADFAVLSDTSISQRESRIIAIIEAKGAADEIVCNGRIERLSRPGMIRTDTVKKAIANAYLVSRVLPDTLFFIVTSHVPMSGNACCMCRLAENDIVDKIVDVTNFDDLQLMTNLIREKLVER